MQEGSLIARDVACRRGERLLLRSFSCTLQPGDALLLHGVNGVGKSSLIRVLAGLSRPFAGTVERNGGVGLIDENPALDERLPLARALAFWGAVDRASCQALDALGLRELADVPVRYLSTGQRKRAAFVRLLTQRCPVWLLDEPLNGLDGAAVTLVERLVANHRVQGGIAVVASHQSLTLDSAALIALEDYVP
ncbi:MAG: heme ABC exporter ATP-binding protein CcmA [Parerythrobacter sp.]